MDNLEKYIKSHRDEFDTEEPRPEVWDKIKGSFTIDEKADTFGSWVWKVAATFLLFTTVYLAFDKWGNTDVELAAAEEVYSEEFLSAEKFYMEEIATLQAQLASYPNQQEVGLDFMADLEGLDSMYVTLKNEFSVTGDNNKVADALIQNLRIRMEIINQQLMILERIKRQNVEENVEI